MDLFLRDICSKEKIAEYMDVMNGFGSRLTGYDGHNAYCEWLKKQITDMGYEVTSQKYSFSRWQSKDCSLDVDGKNIKISSPFPYSGLTENDGVEGTLTEVSDNPIDFMLARGKIAVCHIRNLSKISSKVAFNKRDSVPASLEIDPTYRGPVSTVFVRTLLSFWSLSLSGMKGMVCIWEDMSDEMVEGQWLNFILGYLNVPIVWVNQTEGKKVLAAAAQHKTARLRLIGDIQTAETESFCAVLKGTKDTNEAIIVNTHTDGCNFVEENGGIGILPMMKYFKQHPTERNIVFAFVTGHFRLPKFRTGFDQATSRWLADNRLLWTGKQGGYKAVANCAVEHLGATEWKDVNGVFQKTNDVDIELVYTGNKVMNEIYLEAVKDRSLVRTITLRGHNFMHFGEGQPLFNKRIPEIALVTAPDYLCSVAENHHMDKFNLDLMYEQIHTFVRCVELIDKKTAAEIGKPQPYSLGLGRLK